ncbi:TetR/AcrR family transcriptional regulator [Amorphus coralli]|uniref:TetR/AcrR family transcriptional regulator n=1 Tax=Amorphus coralli TaxID=340680 RepID=UPI00036450A6|nr:TetR/AcrR family transcriptional regulator [Amorphus coralli]
MPRQTESRARLLDAALIVFRTRGYTATRVEDVCAEAGVTKGSFFHHFKTKEELAVAAAERFSEHADTLFAGAPYRAVADPRERLLGYVALRRALLDGPLPEVTCLLGTLVQETYEIHPAIGRAAGEHILAHADEVGAMAAAAKAACAPEADWSAEGLGRHIQAVIQGAFILAKAGGGTDAARECLDHLGRYLELLLPPVEEGRQAAA